MPKGTSTFRLFISSTFTDLEAERNALHQNVFPKLRALCGKSGCRFQAIDLRWGIREEAGLDQRTMEICLEELERCRKVTPRPNFLVLLGDRYGWMPLPHIVEAHEFESLLEHVDDKEISLLLEWYTRDDNAVPPCHYLKPRSGEWEDSKSWQELEGKLHRILLDAAVRAGFNDEKLSGYATSATEQEIVDGALGVPDSGEHVFCFFREIEDPPSDGSAREFVDLDIESGKKLSELKERLEKKLGDNVHCYGASWSGEGPTLIHLDALCKDVLEELSGVISTQIQALGEQDELEREIEEQRIFAEERSEFFTGRVKMLERIAEYLKGADPHPLAVYGEGGSGKSALAAFAIRKAAENRREAQVIYRFIGATPSSSDVREMLESLCRQLARSYGRDESSIPTEYEELVTEFRSRLSLATAEKPAILFIDSLDQLSPSYDAASLNWLPDYLPANVRMVVTTRPSRELVVLREKLGQNVEKLHPMGPEEGGKLLDLWLKNAGRTLQESQKQEVIHRFMEAGGKPLYLKLAFEQASRLKSIEEQDYLPPDIKGIIRDLYARLSSDSNHGMMLVSRMLGYLRVSREGLSEDELLDILSSDKDVFADFISRSRHEPPEKRLPVAIWSRLYYDLEPYLAERTSGGATLLTFYHRELGEVAFDEFLSGDGDENAFHMKLAGYFETTPLGARKVSELPWQLAEAGEWHRLYDLLSDLEFLGESVSRDRFDVRTFWTQIEENSDLDITSAYNPLLECPENFQDSEVSLVASLLKESSHPDEAMSLQEHLINRFRDSGDILNLAGSLSNKAVLLMARGRFDEALELLEETTCTYRSLGYLEGLQASIGNQAVVLQRKGNMVLALELLKEQENICQELGDNDGVAMSLGNQAIIHQVQGNHEEALKLHKKEENIYRHQGNMDGVQRSVGNRAHILMFHGDSIGAMELLEQKEQICGELGDRDGIATSLGNQALILRARGNLEGAMELHKQEEGICRDLGNRSGLARSIGNQAVVLKDCGDLEGAMKLHEQEEDIYRESGELDGLVSSLGNQAIILTICNDMVRAQKLLEEGEGIARKLGNDDSLSRLLDCRAHILYIQEDFDGALELLDEEIEICRKLEDIQELLDAIKKKAAVLAKMGRSAEASSLVGEVQKLAQSQDPTGFAEGRYTD